MQESSTECAGEARARRAKLAREEHATESMFGLLRTRLEAPLLRGLVAALVIAVAAAGLAEDRLGRRGTAISEPYCPCPTAGNAHTCRSAIRSPRVSGTTEVIEWRFSSAAKRQENASRLPAP